MTSLGTIVFHGLSGKGYNFKIYDFSNGWNSVAGVYIISKSEVNREGGQTLAPIYVGETSDLKERMANHHKQLCFNRHNANCLCWLGETDFNKRKQIESDIIQKWSPPCNDLSIS